MWKMRHNIASVVQSMSISTVKNHRCCLLVEIQLFLKIISGWGVHTNFLLPETIQKL